MTSLKGEVKYSCAAGRFEKRVKVEFINVSYMLFLPELSILAVEYFKQMLMYDQKLVKIQKNWENRYLINHVNGSLMDKKVCLKNT